MTEKDHRDGIVNGILKALRPEQEEEPNLNSFLNSIEVNHDVPRSPRPQPSGSLRSSRSNPAIGSQQSLPSPAFIQSPYQPRDPSAPVYPGVGLMHNGSSVGMLPNGSYAGMPMSQWMNSVPSSNLMNVPSLTQPVGNFPNSMSEVPRSHQNMNPLTTYGSHSSAKYGSMQFNQVANSPRDLSFISNTDSTSQQMMGNWADYAANQGSFAYTRQPFMNSTSHPYLPGVTSVMGLNDLHNAMGFHQNSGTGLTDNNSFQQLYDPTTGMPSRESYNHLKQIPSFQNIDQNVNAQPTSQATSQGPPLLVTSQHTSQGPPLMETNVPFQASRSQAAPGYPARDQNPKTQRPSGNAERGRGGKATRGGRGKRGDEENAEPPPRKGRNERKPPRAEEPDLLDLAKLSAAQLNDLCMDQQGSRQVQSSIQAGDSRREVQENVQHILDAVSMSDLCRDIFGNYVVQKCAELGSDQQRSMIIDAIGENIAEASTHMCGCRVIQALIEYSNADSLDKIFRHINNDNKLEDMVTSQNGNHVIQKAIKHMDQSVVDEIARVVTPRCVEFAKHSYGCRVMQRILEKASKPVLRPIFKNTMNASAKLINDQYGNYVLQHIAAHGDRATREALQTLVMNGFQRFAKEKYASNVVEKVILHIPMDSDKYREVCDEMGREQITTLLMDRFANFPMQKMIQDMNYEDQKHVVEMIEVDLPRINSCAHGRHVYSKFRDLGLLSAKN